MFFSVLLGKKNHQRNPTEPIFGALGKNCPQTQQQCRLPNVFSAWARPGSTRHAWARSRPGSGPARSGSLWLELGLGAAGPGSMGLSSPQLDSSLTRARPQPGHSSMPSHPVLDLPGSGPAQTGICFPSYFHQKGQTVSHFCYFWFFVLLGNKMARSGLAQVQIQVGRDSGPGWTGTSPSCSTPRVPLETHDRFASVWSMKDEPLQSQ